MLTFKEGVRIKRMTPALKVILDHLYAIDANQEMRTYEEEAFVFEGAVNKLPRDLVVTSINDSKHAKDSRHYTDEAVDLRSHNFAGRATRRAFRQYLALRLGDRFTVLLEHEGTPNEHFHIQPKKGTTYP